jgi:hypothetical protein
MKVKIRDSDHQVVEVGYEWIDGFDTTDAQPLFWIESAAEVITLHMTPNDLTQLVKTIQYLIKQLPIKAP